MNISLEQHQENSNSNGSALVGQDNSRPRIERNFIQNVASQRDADSLVKTRHQAVYAEYAKSRVEAINKKQGRAQKELDRLEQEKVRLQEAQKTIPDSIDAPPEYPGENTPPPPVPWSKFDLCLFWFLLGFSVFLLGVALNTIASYMIDSGLNVTFVDQPWTAYLTSLLPIGLPIILKLVYGYIPKPRARLIYFYVLVVLGSVAGLAWVGVFASTYPSVAKSSADIVAEVLAGEAMADTSSIRDFWLASLQIVTELLIATVIFVKLENLWKYHTRVSTVENPNYRRLEDRIESIDERILRNEASLDSSENERNQLLWGETAFLEEASSHLTQMQHLMRQMEALSVEK